MLQMVKKRKKKKRKENDLVLYFTGRWFLYPGTTKVVRGFVYIAWRYRKQ